MTNYHPLVIHDLLEERGLATTAILNAVYEAERLRTIAQHLSSPKSAESLNLTDEESKAVAFVQRILPAIADGEAHAETLNSLLKRLFQKK